MTITSTVPGAISTLETYMNTVAAATTVQNVKVYTGHQVQTPAYNFLMVGDYENGLFTREIETDWRSMPAAAKRRDEHYALLGCIQTWEGSFGPTSPTDRVADAFTLLDALMEQIVSDPGGSGSLTPSGSWGKFLWREVDNGPLGDAGGWGYALDFELHVINALIQG